MPDETPSQVSTTPRLQTSLPESGTAYAPLSGFAVAGFAVAVLFVLLLVVLGYYATKSQKHLTEPWLFLFPLAAFILAFVARRHIRDSENTRTGEKLANTAWWISVFGGPLLFAYFAAVEFSVRQEVSNFYTSWTNELKQADATNPDDPVMSKAFAYVLPPGQRDGLKSISDARVMSDRFGPIFSKFRHSRILAIVHRNPGEVTFEFNNLQDQRQIQGGIECVVNGTMKTPEANYPLIIVMHGTSGNAGKVWQILAPDDHINDSKTGLARTNYGWWVEFLNQSATYHAANLLGNPKEMRESKSLEFSLLPGNSRGSVEDIKSCWNQLRTKMPATPINPLTSIKADRIEVRIGVVLQPAGSEPTKLNWGRLVLVLDDPAILAEVAAAKSKASSDTLTKTLPEFLAKREKLNWKVIRLESNMRSEIMRNPADP